MKKLIALAVAVTLCGWTAAMACGPDGKCVGKEKASCCMSKASAKKSCSVKHDVKEAKLETNSNEAQDQVKSTVEPTTSSTAQPTATPKR